MLCAESVAEGGGLEADCVTEGAPIACLGSSVGMVRNGYSPPVHDRYHRHTGDRGISPAVCGVLVG